MSQHENVSGPVQAKSNMSHALEGGGFESTGTANTATPPTFQLQASPIQRQDGQQDQAQRHEGVAATVSWIDPASPAGSQVPDPRPPDTISRGFIAAANGFRFSNHVRSTVTTRDNRTIDNVEHDSMKITRGPSAFGLDSQQYPVQRESTRGAENGVEYVEVNQTVGARTVSHEVVGERVGNVAGAGTGAWAGAKLGAAGGSFFGPLGTAIGGAGGAIVGGVAGWFAGGELGEKAGATAMNFPPIWTDVTMRLYADGRVTRRLNRHSHFPCVTFYGAGNYQGGLAYPALAGEQTTWENSGWGSGNPWGVERYDGRD